MSLLWEFGGISIMITEDPHILSCGEFSSLDDSMKL